MFKINKKLNKKRLYFYYLNLKLFKILNLIKEYFIRFKIIFYLFSLLF